MGQELDPDRSRGSLEVLSICEITEKQSVITSSPQNAQHHVWQNCWTASNPNSLTRRQYFLHNVLLQLMLRI